MMIRKRKRLWALLLFAVLIVAQLPMTTAAANNIMIEVSAVRLEVAIPVAGSSPSTDVNAINDPDYMTPTVTWKNKNETVEDRFDYDTAYTVDVTLKMSENGRFAERVTGTINGKTASVDRRNKKEVVVSYTFDKTELRISAITVNNGTSNKATAAAGETVSITADNAPTGKTFDKWTTEDGVTFANENTESTTFTMPANDVTVTATYKKLLPTTYAVTVNNGTSDKGAAAAGETVSITADNAPTGKTFDKWTTEDGVTFANENTASTTFIMPAKAVTVTATYKALLPNTYAVTVENGTGDGSYTKGATVNIAADNAPSGKVFERWTADSMDIIFDNPNSVSTSFIMPEHAVTVTANFKGKPSGGGSSSGGGGSSYSEPQPQSSYTVAGDNISRSVSRSDLKKLVDDRKSLTLRCDKASMAFDPAALKAILVAVPATAGNITFSAAPADLSAFPDAAKLIGTHPAYDFTIGYKDGKGNLVVVPVNFPAGSASITLNYTPAAAEVTGSLFMVYVDGKGAVTWLDKSSYDNGKVLAEVPHFSTYGVAYKAPAQVFTDIANHWAKADIEFVAARGLLSGTGNNLFSPDGTMTRGMFVTALGRLAGVNPDSYQTRSFTDVKADAYYAAYVEWAAQKNIVKGTGEGLFSPDTPVTREQMAVMMVNYAGQMGYSIPAPLAADAFADNDKISAWAAKEVAAMQRAGIIKGKDGNRFDPQASATRAEVSAVLRRFVEIVIDPVTAQGWGKNDSGQWLYYKDGKAITGWKQLGGKWYYFDKNGIMAVNTKVDGYEIGPDGARKEDN